MRPDILSGLVTEDGFQGAGSTEQPSVLLLRPPEADLIYGVWEVGCRQFSRSAIMRAHACAMLD